jgi:hypothetical protein
MKKNAPALLAVTSLIALAAAAFAQSASGTPITAAPSSDAGSGARAGVVQEAKAIAPRGLAPIFAIEGAEIQASELGIVCDGVTDTTAALNSRKASGHTVHLPDHKVCIGTAPGVNNTRWVCTGCTIARNRNGKTPGGHSYVGYNSNIEFDGITFDLNGVGLGSFGGSPNAATTLLTVSGGKGFEPNFRFAFNTGNSGGCHSPVLGYFTTDARGVPDKAVITVPGTGCTSLPTPQPSSKGWGGDGYANPVQPVFTWAQGAAPRKSANNLNMFFIDHSKNIVFRNCTWRSTGATMGSLTANFEGVVVFESSVSFINPTFESTIAGTHLKVDSGGKDVRTYIKNIRSDGSQLNAIRLTGAPCNTEIDGGLITNVGDMIAGSGEAGNAISLYVTSRNKIHGVTIVNPRFTGIRVMGGASTYNQISDVTIKGNREVGVWAELGAEFNSFDNISISQCDGGVHGTNIKDRPHGGTNTFTHLLISGCKSIGVAVEEDSVTDSTVIDTPIPFSVGFGGTGKDNVLKGNTCESTGKGYSLMPICFGIDRYAQHASLISENNPIKGTGVVGVAALEFSNRLIIKSISNSKPAVISYNPNVNVKSAAPAVGTTYLLSSIFGMLNSAGQSINGHLCTVSAVNMTASGPNPYSITCGGSKSLPALDTTSYNATPYQPPPQGQGNPRLLELYKNGDTTPYWPLPAPVATRNAFKKAQ